MSKPGCHGNVNFDVHVMATLKCFQIVFRKRRQFSR